jgi:hypothetical protein
MIKSSQLRYITGAYFSGMGYYSEISPEVPGINYKPDVLAIKPIPKEVSLRFDKGGAPVGIIYQLKRNLWTSTKDILEKSGLERNFVNGVLREAEENNWIKKQVDPSGDFSWKIDKYRVPASECLMIMCAAEQPLEALKAIDVLAGCYSKAYLAFPYHVDDVFLHECTHHMTGVMIFNETTASFITKLPAKRQKITNFKAYASICERTIISHTIMNPKNSTYLHKS